MGLFKKDNDIRTISAENIGYIDSDDIVTVGKTKRVSVKQIVSYVFVVIFTLILTGVILFAVNVSINMKIVEGDIAGSNFQIAGFSFVDNDYDPSDYLYAGCTILYNCDSDSIFTTSSNYDTGIVASLNSSNVTLEDDNYLRTTTVKIAQIDYVLN